MAKLTLKSLKADLDALRADYDALKGQVLDYLKAHSGFVQPPIEGDFRFNPPIINPPIVWPPPTSDLNNPVLFIQPVGNLNDPAFRDYLIELASQRAYGEPANQDRKNYWTVNWPGLVARGIQIEVPDYAWKRMIGWQATGADKAKYGPYA